MDSESSNGVQHKEINELRAKVTNLELSESQHKVNEKKLFSSEERFRLLVESVKDYAIFMLDPTGRIESWNAGAQNIKGYLAHEIIGQHFSKFYPPEDIAWDKPKWELEQAGSVGRFEDQGWRLRKDGTRFWANVIITALRDKNGTLSGFAKVTRDMTEAKIAEDIILQSNIDLEKRVRERTFQLGFLAEASKLLASSFNYETILQKVAQLAVPDLADWCAFYILDEGNEPRQVALAHNNAKETEWALYEFSKTHTYDPNVQVGLAQVLRTGLPEFYPVIEDELLLKVAKSEEHFNLLRKLGMKSVLIMPLIARGKVLGAVQLVSTQPERQYSMEDHSLVQDFAQRAGIAVDNVRLYEDAQKAISLRNEFLSIAAHELKTPITSLRGFSQLVLRKLNMSSTIDQDHFRQALTHINTQSVRLANLVSRLLDISQLEAGKLILKLDKTNLNQLLQNIVAVSQVRAENHTISLEADPQLEAQLDPLRFEQVIVNLLDNAIKYSPEGGPVDVKLVYLPERKIARISVQDQGMGIEPHNRARIFEPFYQGHERGYAGLGLGLYISRQIIELHGGSIEAEFGEQKGTTFIVTLPINL